MQLSTVKGPSSHLHFFPNVRVFLQHVSAHGGRFRGQFESGMELHLAAASVTHLTCFPTFLMIYMVQTWVEQHASLGWVDFVSTLTCACDSGITIILPKTSYFLQGILVWYHSTRTSSAERPHDCVAFAALHIPSFLPRFGMRILCAQLRDLTIFWDDYEYQWHKSCREGPS